MSLVLDRPDWREFIKGKWLLWDTNAISDVVSYDGTEIFEILRGLNVVNVYIHPVQLESLATNNQKDRLARSNILISEFTEIPLIGKIVIKAKEIQTALSGDVQPSIADLYLAGTLGAHAGGQIVLLTRNVKDFPDPYFKRNCYLQFEGPRNTISTALITINNEYF